MFSIIQINNLFQIFSVKKSNIQLFIDWLYKKFIIKSYTNWIIKVNWLKFIINYSLHSYSYILIKIKLAQNSNTKILSNQYKITIIRKRKLFRTLFMKEVLWLEKNLSTLLIPEKSKVPPPKSNCLSVSFTLHLREVVIEGVFIIPFLS